MQNIDPEYLSFVENITATLEKNGYPSKRVALPLERMYEVAHDKGLNFNRALAILEERGISHEKTTERVIFSPKQATSGFRDMMAEAQKVVGAMSPEEREQLIKMYQNMSQEQKDEVLRQAKAMGLEP